MNDIRGRHWCITINNYSTDESVLRLQFEHPSVQYSIRGYEVGDSGTPHLQAFVTFRNRQRLAHVKRVFLGCHAELKRGTIEQAIEYCKKDEVFIEHGDPPQESNTPGNQATIEKWDKVKDSAKRGNLEEIPSDIFVRYYSALKRIMADNMQRPQDLDSVCGLYYYGIAGSGKTTKARAEYPGSYIKSRDRWWDGYQGEETVILDDLDKYHVALAGLIKDWADKWTFKAEVKGGYIWIRPLRFIITSQYSIDQIWDDIETRQALHRRFTCTHFASLINT